MHAYITLSLLCGLRTEEARALRWAHVDLDGDPQASPPVPPHVAVSRSVRTHGETKTERSRRTLALPAAAQALRGWTGSQAAERHAAGDDWQDTGLVFTSHHGAALDAGNVRKMFKRICTEAGAGDSWTPRELRTTFVSLLSHQGVSIEEIARLAGHATTRTTEIVYRRELRPVITTGAEIMDQVTSTPASAAADRSREAVSTVSVSGICDGTANRGRSMPAACRVRLTPRSISDKTMRDSSSSTMPASVSRTPSRRRRNSGVPTISSSRRICWLSVGCAI